MGGADGAGKTTAAVEQFNFRRTPITSGDVDATANHGYWQQKEAEYNALDAHSQAKLSSSPRMLSALESDWNHLKEISIPGLESTPFKQLIPAYPKKELGDGAMSGLLDLVTIRQFYGNPAIGAFMNGPVFDDTRVHGNMFSEFMAQTRAMAYGNIRDGVIYERLNADEDMPLMMMRRIPMLPPAPQQEIAQELIRDFNEMRVSGFDARLDVGHFVVPVTQQEPQQQVVRRPLANNMQAQGPPQQWNNRFNHPNNQGGNQFNNHNHGGQHGNHHHHHHHHNNNHHNCAHGRRGGFVNNRGGGRHGNQQRAQVNQQVSQNPRPAVAENAPSTSTPARTSPHESKRGQRIPINVVIVDRVEEPGPSLPDSNGNIVVADGYRMWTRKRPNNGLPKNTTNTIFFDRDR
ncbi:unnamed protein product [Caenorhabditis brenneri]